MRPGRLVKPLAAVAVMWAALAFAQTPTCPSGPPCQGGVLPGPLPLFPASNWWNLDISTAPVDSNSANFIAFIGSSKTLHPDFGGEVSPGSVGVYGFPYVIVSGAQPKKIVNFLYAGESDGVGVPFYPIPDQVITLPHWIEEGSPGNVDLRADSDRHVLIVDTDNKLLYELYNVFYDTSISTWQAGSGALFDLKTNNRRPEGFTSADASGMALLPGLVRYDEAYTNPDPIRHAIRVTLRATNNYVFPASHLTCDVSQGDPCPANALPMGARLRLKSGVAVSSPDSGVQRMVQAMKTYGMIVADNGSDMYFSGTFDTRWDNGILNPAFLQLHASDFEVIQRGYGSNFTDLSVTKTDNLASANPGQPVTYTIVVSNAGPSVAIGATVVDNLPAEITGATWTCAGAAAGDCVVSSGSGNINRIVNLPAGGSVTYTLTGTISAAATGSLSNTATVTAPGGVTDPTPGNNSATDTDTLTPPADLGITKTDGQTTAVPGTPVTYTIVVSNAGPSAAIGATVVDAVPAEITGATWICVSAGGATCTASGSGSINQTVNLPVGGTVTYTLTGTISATAKESLANTATVGVPSGMSDPNPANNSATDGDVLPGVDYYTLTPCRVVDTRGGAPIGGPALPGQQTRVLAMAGKCGIPATARAISINLAVTGATAPGNVRLFPAGQAVPLVSSINYVAGQTRANNAVVKLDSSGGLSAFNGQASGTTVHLIIDVNGYFQ